ncbi:MFS transporter [Actinoallomurus rhizosphaericola]|uniref:MFS transporter n=1 Tax=Actinoallomurus rhizosphaericola TaxID=2952536 RepID=UPI002090E396|nr:MFS transporter [Actinoallomurus rhizosphaericola]MCO5994742.1 MFS transporter [Actinoallomurus rhizosphaericola]
MAQITLDAPAAQAPVRRGGLLTLIMLGQFMAVLDVTVVNVAAPTIRTDLQASGAGLQLVIAGYTIAYAVLLITGARLGDILGHRRAFLGGLAVFTASSLACGLAGSTGLLIGFRLVQGAGAALMVPQVMSLIQRNFTGAARARALSVYSAVLSGGAVAGQVIGGALVSADVLGTGWRPVFLVNVPIGVVLLIAGPRVLPGDRGERGRRLDVPGVLGLSAAVVCFVVPLVLGHEEGWPGWGWAMLAGGVVVFGVFVVLQRRAAAPLIPGRLLRTPGVLAGGITIFFAMGTFGGFLFSLALHLQGGLGDSPLRAGLSFIPGAGGFALASLNWRRVPARWHRLMVPAAFAVAALGYLGLAVFQSGGTGLEVAMALTGLGLGGAFSPMLTLALGQVPVADAADASGLLVTMNQLAQVVGVATFGTVFLSVAPPTGHALAVTSVALAATAVLGGCCSILAVRPRRTA